MFKGVLISATIALGLVFSNQSSDAQGNPWESRDSLKSQPQLKPFQLPIQREAMPVRNEKFRTETDSLKFDYYRLTPTGIMGREGKNFALVDINGQDLNEVGTAEDEELSPSALIPDYGFVSMLSITNNPQTQIQGFGVFHSQYAVDRAKNYRDYLISKNQAAEVIEELNIESRGRFVAFVLHDKKIYETSGVQNGNILVLESQNPNPDFFNAVKSLQLWDDEKLGGLLRTDRDLRAQLSVAPEDQRPAIIARREQTQQAIRDLKENGERTRMSAAARSAIQGDKDSRTYSLNLELKDGERAIKIALDPKDAIDGSFEPQSFEVNFVSWNDGQAVDQERLNYIHQLVLQTSSPIKPTVGIFSEYFRFRDYRLMICESYLELHQPLMGSSNEEGTQAFSYTIYEGKLDLAFAFDLKRVPEQAGLKFDLLYWIASQDEAGGKTLRTFSRDLKTATLFVAR